MQRLGDRVRLRLAYSSSVFSLEVLHFALDVVQRLEELQRLLAELAAMVGPQFMELAPRVSQASDLGHAEFEAGLVARVMWCTT